MYGCLLTHAHTHTHTHTHKLKMNPLATFHDNSLSKHTYLQTVISTFQLKPSWRAKKVSIERGYVYEGDIFERISV